MVRKLTKEEFVKRAEDIHKNRYNYLLVDYNGNKAKIKIICKEHGVFEQTPNSHLLGKGCQKCANNEKSNTEEFIIKAKKIHGDKYDYSLVDYNGSNIKIKIICNKHGIFQQTPRSHLDKQGCPKCVNKLLTTKDFIEKAQNIHGDKYNYSQADYSNSYTKIKIICKEHGLFWQTPSSHLNYQGCPKCARNRIPTTEEFIAQAKKIHGDKYGYRLTNYINCGNKIKIICKEHGLFEQTPNIHLDRHGCPKCANNEKSNTEEFIIKAKKIHGNKYDYSLVDYINAFFKIKIKCKIHGIFQQTPNSHLSGYGCLKCAEFSFISKSETAWLDSLNINKTDRQKILIHNNKRYKVDAYIKETNTIYEFYGDFYHGNPNKFNQSDYNHRVKKTFGELYQHTIERENELKSFGYNIVTIWESDFKKL